ncbi:fumarylacetoacetate hydrolase family protein [Tropicimonas sp. IMCC34043]|uniref:fumarylacetoacetate hydrolase family protein n=1 Tax=Tropicimonas sp. IMCC34043 TaxID=2248760 RepID=UPI000E22AE48|nr:fumarylacetoacetate hydrolase family protein [Tropicimonas sp. IMCC34043]
MKFCRIRTADGIVPAAVDDAGVLRSLAGHIGDLTRDSVAYGGLAPLEGIELSTLPALSERDYAPVLADIRRIFCIGLNYVEHAAESGSAVPDQPLMFMKVCPPSGATDPVIIPKGSEKTDWEVELGVVIGRKAAHVTVDQALDHVAGYCVVNDVSERHFQKDCGGQWVKGKSCDSFAPVGPWLVTPDEVPDPQALDLFLDVNGVRRQTGHTSWMVFPVAELIAHISRFITLLPGDLIATGTPPGVGMGMTPPQYLKPGDRMRLGITGLGEQDLAVEAYAP